MASVRETILETAALGRPFQLGMLYDCRSDSIVPGITLWNREQLQQNKDVSSQVNTEFTVTTSDTIKEKSKHLKVDGELKLSLLGGNVQPSGAARYFNDTKKSFKQERLTLHYRTTCRFEQLTMNHLAQGKMDHHEVFDHNVATHVVTAVLYGADAYFVFDREVNLSEEIKDVQGEMKVALKRLNVLCDGGAHVDLNMNENETAAVKQLSCTFYGDFMLPSNPTTFEGAMKVYADLPELLGQNGEHAVPIKVWLYPLVKLNSSAAKLHRNIASELIRAVESVIEALNITDMKCDDLLEDTVAKTVSTFHDRVQDFQKFCSEYKQDFMKKLGSLLPEIRGGQSDISAMNELIEAHEKSPFNTKGLEQWITKKEKESMQVKALLKQLHELGAEVTDDVDKYLLDLDVEIVVAFAFTCLRYSDLLLGNQEIYLKNPSENTTGQVPQDKSWTSNELMCMKNNLKVFKELITSNKSQNTKFIVQNLPQTSNDDCSCILMYECSEAVRFVPPSKPKCPNLESVTDSSITVELSPPCAATLERKLLYKMKQETNWNEQPVNQDMVTLMDLTEGTDYEIKCGALGKLDYLVESDAITFKTKSLRDLMSAKSESTQQVAAMRIIKNIPQGHRDQTKDMEIVDSRTIKRTTNKVEKSVITQNKRDQPLNSDYPHIQMEQSLVEKMEKRHEEWHAEMNMEKKQLQEFKKCVEINKKILSEKDAELLEANKALKCAVKQIEETKTQLRRVEEELKTTHRKLKQKQTQLTDKERDLEDMIQEQETSKNTIMELEKQILVKDRQIKGHETTFQQVTTILDDSFRKQQCMESKNTRLENLLSDTHQELETCKTKLVAMEQELQRRITIQEQQEKQRNKQLEEKERLLTERDTQLQEKNKCLKNLTQALQMKNKTLDKKDTLLRDVNEELRKTKMTLEENQSQLREKERQLDSVMKELDTSKTKLKEGDKELQDKDRYLNGSTDELKMKNKTMEEKDTHLPEVKEELEKTSGTLEQTDKRVTQEKEEDGEGAVMGIITCQTQSQNKSQNKDQQANEEEEENKENSIQVTGALNKDAITESQNTSKETQERKGSQHEEDEEEEEEEEANDTGEPQQEVKETEKNNEHQNDEDTETKEKNSDRDQSSENNKNSSCEGNTFLIKTTGRQTNATENNRAYKCNLSDSQTQDKDGLQLDNPLNPQRAEEQDTNTSDVKDESEKQTMEGQDSKSKENECVLKLESSKVNSESQEEEQEETEPEPLGDDTDRATDSSGNETA